MAHCEKKRTIIEPFNELRGLQVEGGKSYYIWKNERDQLFAVKWVKVKL